MTDLASLLVKARSEEMVSQVKGVVNGTRGIEVIDVEKVNLMVEKVKEV